MMPGPPPVAPGRKGPRRNRLLRPGPVIALAALLVVVVCGGGTVALFLDGLSSDSPVVASAGAGCGATAVVNPDAPLPRLGSYGDAQMRNAAVIVQVGQRMKVPPRGWIIAVATAMQESMLHNLPNLGAANDHDSVGLFQQRPSQGWGTPEQLRDPAYAARRFYDKLLTVPNWAGMPLTDAAQAVQHSAYPDAYAKHEPDATAVVNALTGGAGRAAGSLVDLRCAGGGEISAAGWTVPVRGTITSGFRPPDRPTHNGVDLGVGKGTPVHAAAAGTVLVATCNAFAPDGSPYSCDVDGSVNIRGCGWYVDILHPGNIITRYCHMEVKPYVVAGQQVAAGQVIGLSGSSGNSSGPHLHFEVHVNGDSSANGAIDPIPYMRSVGAPLGASA